MLITTVEANACLDLMTDILFVLVTVMLMIAIILIIRVAGAVTVVQLSHLVWSRCGRQFDYAWIPGMSLTFIRLFDH